LDENSNVAKDPIEKWNQGATMTGGIALLLRGSPVDLPAAFRAIELAKRTTGVVHAVLVEQGEEDTGKDSGEEVNSEMRMLAGQFIALAGWMGDVEGVTIHVHTLDSPADELLILFLCRYQIFCLIFGVESQRLLRRKTVWVAQIRRLLAKRADCFCPRLWSVIIPPGDEREYADLIDRCVQATGRDSAMGMLIDTLRNGLKGLNNKKAVKKKV
jgi:hypothetical protein